MVSTTLTTIVATSAESNNHRLHHTQGYTQHPQSRAVRSFYVESDSKFQSNSSGSSYNGADLSALPSDSLTSENHQPATPADSPLLKSDQLKNDSVAKGSSELPHVNDKISILFPKCRPKHDVSVNATPKKINHASSGNRVDTSPTSSSLSSESLSSVAPRISTNPFLHSTDETLEDITAASQTHQFDVRGTRNFQIMPRKRSYHGNNQNPFIKDTYWESRHNSTPVSTVLNSPDLTENESRNSFVQKQHVKVGRSPISHTETLPPISLDTPTRGLTVVADGEVVVFDDIVEGWQNLRVTTDQGNGEHNQETQQPQSQLCINDPKDILMEQSTYEQREGSGQRKIIDRNFSIPMGIRHGIIEYEGSPRRIGQGSPEGGHLPLQLHLHRTKPYNTSTHFHTARPGFPQRVFPQPPETPSPTANDILQSNTEDTSNDVSEIGTSSDLTPSENPKSSTFDYLYEFSETRKVLEEFFKCPSNEEKPTENTSDVDSTDVQYGFGVSLDHNTKNHVEPGVDSSPISIIQHNDETDVVDGTEHELETTNNKENHDIDFFLDSASRSSADILEQHDRLNQNRVAQRTFRYSPDTTDYDSNCGDLDSLSGEYNGVSPYGNYSKCYSSMPVLEDGLSSGHASDTENNNQPTTGISILMEMKRQAEVPDSQELTSSSEYFRNHSAIENGKGEIMNEPNRLRSPGDHDKVFKNIDPDLDSLYSISIFHRPDMTQLTPPPPAPAPHRKSNTSACSDQRNTDSNITALKDMLPSLSQSQPVRSKTSKVLAAPILPSMEMQRSLTASSPSPPPPALAEKVDTTPVLCSPVWIPRQLETSNKNSSYEIADHHSKNLSADEEDVDTDLETDRLLGHQRLDDQGFYDEGKSWDRRPRSLLASSLSKFSPKVQQASKNSSSNILRQGLNSLLPTTPEIAPPALASSKTSPKLLDIGESTPSPEHNEKSSENISDTKNCLTDSPDGSNKSKRESEKKGKKSKNKEVLIEGVLFRARYLGSTQLVCEGQPTKSTRMMQAEEAVSRIKAPDGEGQPSTEVDLFISTEKIMVLNTDLKEIMMDHALRTISYIADIGDLVVLMARRRFVPQDIDDAPKPNRTPKMICHVFESDEAQFIAQSIGQAFQVAYMEFLKANGIEDHSFVKEMDYQEVLNSQEIFGDELEIFAKKELQKEVVVPKAKGEILGVVIVESGWGSMLPTVVIANLMSTGAAARCGQLNIGDQLIAINGLSLVGLPLSTCQNYIKNSKNQTVVKFTVVPCAPVVEVKIKRPNTKYQLGFSVQNGVICSLLRGGIAERGGVRVGHRIIEINNQSVVAVPHEKIVNLLATSVGEILMKTMPTSMFRLLTGQENPIYI